MAKKILIAYNFNANEIQNARIHQVAGNPSTPATGQIWYDTTANLMKWQNNAGVIDPLARANHSGTQVAATISDLATTVKAYSLDQFAVPAANINANSKNITNLADGVNPQDAATVNQVNNIANGRSFKNAVRCVSVGNQAALSGLLTIDGVTLVAGDRVLLAGQTTASQNGIYVAASGAWTRATDADSAGDLSEGSTVLINEGTTYADKQFSCTTQGVITIGTTATTWVLTGQGTTYTGGTGISVAGATISIDATVVVKKYAATFGDGAALTYTLTHGLGTLDTQVQVVEVATGNTVECDVTGRTTTQVTLGFTVAPAANTLRAVVQG